MIPKNTEYKVLNYKYGDHTTTTYYYVYKAGVIEYIILLHWQTNTDR